MYSSVTTTQLNWCNALEYEQNASIKCVRDCEHDNSHNIFTIYLGVLRRVQEKPAYPSHPGDKQQLICTDTVLSHPKLIKLHIQTGVY